MVYQQYLVHVEIGPPAQLRIASEPLLLLSDPQLYPPLSAISKTPKLTIVDASEEG
jgi:hypothetical protein